LTEESITKTKLELFRFWNSEEAYYRSARNGSATLSSVRGRMLRYLAKARTVLDVGCGSCENGNYIPPPARYVGCDVSRLALKMGRDSRNSNFSAVQGDVEFLPFDSDSFDAVISTYAMEHFCRPLKVLDECWRVCKPGGRIVIICPVYDSIFAHPSSVNDLLRSKSVRLRYYVSRIVSEIIDIVNSPDPEYVPAPRIITNPAILTHEFQSDYDVVYLVRTNDVVRYFKNRGAIILAASKGSTPWSEPKGNETLFVAVEKAGRAD
jgi:SAM-dependent methyltransferase